MPPDALMPPASPMAPGSIRLADREFDGLSDMLDWGGPTNGPVAATMPVEFNRRGGGGGGGRGGFGGGARGYLGVYPGNYNPAGQWLTQLFPQVPPPPQKPKEPKKPWPEEARKLARSLLRNDQVLGFKEGLKIERQTESFDPRWGQLTGRSQTVTLVSPAAWTTVSASDGSQTVVSWCDGKVRGVFGTALQLGTQRAVVGQASSLSKPEDLAMPPVGLCGGYATDPLDLAMQGYTPEIKPQDGNRTLLVLHMPKNPQIETQILIDTTRKVVLSIETRQDGKATSTTRYSDFVEVAAGSWYAGAPKRSTPRAGGPA